MPSLILLKNNKYLAVCWALPKLFLLFMLYLLAALAYAAFAEKVWGCGDLNPDQQVTPDITNHRSKSSSSHLAHNILKHLEPAALPGYATTPIFLIYK